MIKPCIRSLLHSALFSAGLMAISGCVQDGGDKKPADTHSHTHPLLPDAGPDTTVSIGDSIELRGRAHPESAPIWSWEWDVGNTGTFLNRVNGDIVISVPSSPGTMENVLRVVAEDGRIALDTMRIQILVGKPVANAGRDTSVTLRDKVQLRGHARSFGRIVKWEWDVEGTGNFVTSSRDTDVVALDHFGLMFPVLRVTDDLGQTDLDSLQVTVVNDFPVVRVSIRQRSRLEGGGMLLQGAVSDLGHIAKWEWDLGNGTFVPGGNDTAYRPTQPEGELVRVRVRVTDDDGNLDLDTGSFVKTNWELHSKLDAFTMIEPNTIVNQSSYSLANWGGKLFIAGFQATYSLRPDGELVGEKVTTSALSFDTATQRWTREDPNPEPAIGNVLVSIGDRLFSVGGRTIHSQVGDGLLYEYIPAIKGWFQRRNLPKGLEAGAPVVLDGTLYYFGFIGDTRTTQVWKYGEQTDSWENVGGYSLSATGSWKINGVVAIGGGLYLCASDESNMSVFRFSPEDRSWAALEGRFRRYEHLAPAAVGNRIYFLGGDLEGGRVPVMLVYDILSHEWKHLPPSTSHPQWYATPIALNGEIYNLAEDFAVEVYTPY
jgi:hypothetical protein